MPLIPALKREASGSEFKTSLVYKVSSRTAKATQRNPVSNKKHTMLCLKKPLCQAQKQVFYMGPCLCPLKRIGRGHIIIQGPPCTTRNLEGLRRPGAQPKDTGRSLPQLQAKPWTEAPSIGQRDVETTGSDQPGEVPSSSTETEPHPQQVSS